MKNILSHLTEGSAYNVLQDIAFGFQKSQILFTAVKFDIFTLINQHINTADKLAEKLDADREALVQLLDTLTAMSLLQKQNLIYSNTLLSEKHLVKTSKEYYGFLLYNADLWNS
jgi:predicted transcriptional regulator